MCGRDYKRCGLINDKEEEFRRKLSIVYSLRLSLWFTFFTVYNISSQSVDIFSTDRSRTVDAFRWDKQPQVLSTKHSHNACRSVHVLVLVNEQVVPESSLPTL